MTARRRGEVDRVQALSGPGLATADDCDDGEDVSRVRLRYPKNLIIAKKRERRWFVLERPRCDTNGGSETEVTVTSKLQANAERNKEIEERQEREEKAASYGGAVRGSVPEDELSGEGARHSEAESEGGRRPECPG